jgi:DNA-directed RNA polymerase subunit M/transcription elongation factor TFIIS
MPPKDQTRRGAVKPMPKREESDASGSSDSDDDGDWDGTVAGGPSTIQDDAFIAAVETFGVSREDAVKIMDSMRRNEIIGGPDAVCQSHESLYDVVASATTAFAKGEDIDVYLKHVKEVNDAFTGGENYGDLGGTFATAEFSTLRAREIHDIDRKIRGPQLKKGIVRCRDRECPSYKTKNTTTVPKQVRSADEPMNFFHSCRTCGANWAT